MKLGKAQLITLSFDLTPTDGIRCRKSPNEVSPFTEQWGHSQHHTPLPEWSTERPGRQLQLHRTRTQRKSQTSVSWLEQTDLWERLLTWTGCASRWLQGNKLRFNKCLFFCWHAKFQYVNILRRYHSLCLISLETCFPLTELIFNIICCTFYTSNGKMDFIAFNTFCKCWISVTAFFLLLSISCQIQDGSWHQSRFFFHTQDSRQLPIIDLQEFPTQPNSQRHKESSPVCFLWHQHHCPVALALLRLLKRSLKVELEWPRQIVMFEC